MSEAGDHRNFFILLSHMLLSAKNIILALGLVLFVLPAMPAEAQTLFKTQVIRLSDGLPSENIYHISEDTAGNLYLATNRGIVLYDGYRFVPLSDITSAVQSLVWANDRFFGFSEQKGIVTFKNIFDRPHVIRANNFFDADPNNDTYNQLYADRNNQLWCSDFNNIKFYGLSLQDSGLLTIDTSNREKRDEVVFCEPHPNEVWAITYKGIFVYHQDAKTFQRLANKALNSQSYSTAFYDGKDSLYLATTAGSLWRYSVSLGQATPLPPLPGNEAATHMRTMDINGSRHLLIASLRKLYLYNTGSKTYKTIADAGSSIIQDLYVSDKQHIIWLATTKGVIKLTLPFNYLRIYALPEKQNRIVGAIAAEDTAHVWMAEGNMVWEYANNNWHRYRFPSPGITCNSIFIHHQTPVLSTSTGIFLIEHNRLKKMDVQGAYSNAAIRKCIIDSRNNIWIIPVGSPPVVYDGYTRKEKKDFIVNRDSIATDNAFYDILENNDGRIWLAAWFPKSYGIAYYDTADKRIKSIARMQDNEKKFMGDYYLSVGKANDNNELLFCGGGGWNRVSAGGKLLGLFNTEVYKMPSNIVQCISQDRNNNIWFSTNEGLDVYNPLTDKAIHISQADGLPSNDLIYGYCQAGNHLLLGVEDALVCIDQQKILETQFSNKLQLTTIYINGVMQPYAGNHITLEKEESDVELGFSTLSYSELQKVVYRYRFANDSSWIPLGSRSLLSLIKLQAGDYIIEVQAGDNLGNWQPNALFIYLKVPAPYYKTLWFVVLMMLLVLAVLFFTIRYYFMQQKIKYQLNARIKDVRMQALRSQMNPHFIFNVLNSIESYIVENDAKTASRLMQKFATLCRLILENAAQSEVNAEREWEALKLYTEFEAMRFSHQFSYSFEKDEDLSLATIRIPPMMVQPLIENAIHHGLRHSDKKNLQLKISVRKLQQALGFIIQDNGVGLKHLNDPEKKKKNNVVKQNSLGLSMIKERVDIINQTMGKDIAFFSLTEKENTTIATLILPVLT